MTVKGVNVETGPQKSKIECFKDNKDIDNNVDTPRLCCLEGCLATSSVGFSFFVAMPTGILLLVYSQKDNHTTLFITGTVLIIFPFLILIMVVVLCVNKHRLKFSQVTSLSTNDNVIEKY